MGNKRCKVALALQGGGAHGAFTWGVLDRMLQEPEVDVIGVTGTSAGARNAVVLADGLLRGGPEEARRRLRKQTQPQNVANTVGHHQQDVSSVDKIVWIE
jgi:NTE family protein